MALTITTNTVNTVGTGTTAFTFGQRLEWDIGIVSDGLPVGFFNSALFFNPAMWLEKYLPNNNIVFPPQQGWSVQLPGVPGSGFLNVVPGSNTLPWSNIRIEYTLTSDTVLSLKLIFISSFDLCSYMENQALNNTPRLSKNSINAASAFTNFERSVYNEEKALRGHVVLANTATQSVHDQVFAEYLMESRFLEDGVLGAAPEFDTWAFSLERGGLEVTDISTYDNTTLKVSVNSTVGAPSADTSILVYRDDAAENIVGFEQDLKIGYEDSTGPKEGIDYIASFTTWVLDSGTTYIAEWELDASKFDFGGSYKFIVIIANGAKSLFNSASTKTTISATANPTPTTGTMTGEIYDYNDVYTNDCLQVTAYERIKSCVEVDKASYDTELSGKGLPGDFDSNFISVRVRLILGDANILDPFDPANTVIFDVNDKAGDPALTTKDTFNDFISCLIFRTQPEWANIPFVVIHTYTYNIAEPNNPYTDVIHYQQLFNLDGLQEDTGNNFLTGITFEDQAGDPVKEICEDFNGPLVVKVTKVGTLPDDYNLIAGIKPDVVNADVEEEESYNNNTLDQLDSSLLLNVDATFGGDDEAQFEVEDSLLELGQKYRIIAIAKKVNPTPPTACPVINIATQTEVTAEGVLGGNQFADLDIDFTITNFAPSTVSAVDISTDINQFSTGPQVDNFLTDTGSYTYTVDWVGVFNNNPITVLMDIDVTLTNGCTYSYTAEHIIIPIVGAITTDDDDVNAD
jgi:hypothetical protein